MNRSRRSSKSKDGIAGAIRRREKKSFQGVGHRCRRSLGLERLEDRQLLAGDLQLVALTPNASGFVAEFNQAVDPGVLNLYDAANGTLGAADVQLTGNAGGQVRGSLLVEANRLRFIATGGPLPADTYNVLLRSAADGLRAADGGAILDGEFSGEFPSGDGVAGGDFSFSFTVAGSEALVVGIPDFARGPDQAVNVPAAAEGVPLDSGLPITLSNAAGVTSLVLTVAFDSELLFVSDVTLGPDAPEGSQVTANLTVPGQATIAFFSLDPLPAGTARIVSLAAAVPATAPYGAVQAVRLTNVDVNAGALAATADDGLHAVVFVGDANRNLRYDAEDARLLARVGVGFDSGFAVDPPHTGATGATRILYPTIDPRIIGDVTGDGTLSALDASDLLRRVVGLSTPNIPALPDNVAPQDIVLSPNSVSEDAVPGTVVGILTAVDPDLDDSHTFIFVSGAGDTDNAAFTIDGQQLRTAVPLDLDTQSIYQIRVRATDAAGLSVERALTIQVTIANAAPTAVLLSPDTVPEDASAGTVVGQLTAADPNGSDVHTFQLVAGEGAADNAAFTIVGQELRTAVTLDFETQSEYLIRVRATDLGGLSVETSLVIQVTDVNEAPSDVSLALSAVAEDAVAGTVVGVLTAVDQDAGDAHTFELVAGEGDADNDAFEIVGQEVRTVAALDFETQSEYRIRVRATDLDGLSVEKSLIIQVTDVNEAPTGVSLNPSAVAEDAPAGTVVGALTAVDPDAGDTHTFELIAGEGDADNDAFEIVDQQLRTVVALDFETQSEYQIRVRATDLGGLSVETSLVIQVTDVNDAPTAVILTPAAVAEDAPVGTVVGVLTAIDQDAGDTHTFELIAGEGDADNDAFEIVDQELRTVVALDFETQSEYQIRVRATDLDGLSVETSLIIQVTDVNEAPTEVVLSPSAVADDAPVGTIVGVLTAVDQDAGDTHTFELIAGEGDADNDAFEIVDQQLRTVVALDFETQSEYQIRVRATDLGGSSVETTLVVLVIGDNEAPSEVLLAPASVSEDASPGTMVGLLTAVDPNAGDVHTFELVTGEGDSDNDAFEIVGQQLRTVVALDFETQGEYQIRVRATDLGGLSVETSLVIQVTDVNEAPSGASLTPSAVAEDAPVGTVVGLLTAIDQDVGDTHTFEFIAGEGGADNDAFEIVDQELRTVVALDFETQSEYQIRVRATDLDGLSVETSLVIQVTDVNEAPSAVTLTPSAVAEDALVGTVVGLLTAIDQDAGDTHTFEFITGEGDADNAAFEIIDQELRTVVTLDFETQSEYQIRVRATDLGGLSVETSLIIQVTDVNEAPTGVTLTPSAVADDAPVGTVVGVLTATDQDAGDAHTFELVAGDGAADNDAFEIVDQQLRTVATLDFETQSEYQIRVRATDLGGLSVETTLVVLVIGDNEAPTEVLLAPTSISEDASVGTAVGLLTAVDPNAGDVHIFELVAGEGDADNGTFEIVGQQLRTAVTLDFETQSEYQIRVRATDLGGLSVETSLVVQVTDVNEAPSDVILTPATVAEDVPLGSVVGQLTAVDPDAGDVHTFEFIAGEGGADNDAFEIVDQELRTVVTLDFETQSEYQIRVRATDLDGLSVETSLIIQVTDVNEAPTEVLLASDGVSEDASVGTMVGLLTAVDPDAGDTHTFEFIAGEGDADNTAFEIVDQELRTAVALDFETQSEYQIRVRATDLGGLSVETALVVFVTNVNEAPVHLLPGAQSTLMNESFVFSAATSNAITITDPDAGDDQLKVNLIAEGGTVSVDEFFGSLAELNDLLDGLLFTPDEDFVGDAFLDIMTDDLGHNGSGGPQTAVDRIMISVT